MDATEQIRRLAELRDSGALTDEEFEAKKTELLGRI
jgi:Short C-terminal domain